MRKLVIMVLIILMVLYPVCATQNRDVKVDVKNTNININGQKQTQDQNQEQNQEQNQDQKQSQTIIINQQSVIDSASRSISQLDVGESVEYSRLVYPGEVLPFDIDAGDIITLKSSSDVAIYTIGTHDDNLRINSMESIPVYDPVYHRFEFGIVVPIDKIGYWTTKATITASEGAKYAVVDNRAPMNSYTHIEVTITGG